MKERKIKLNLSPNELLMLEVALEFKCKELLDMGISFDKEKALLEKIYQVSPSNPFGRLPLKRMLRDFELRKELKNCSIDIAKIVIC